MTVKSVQSNVVKIAQTFAFGRRKANHGGLPGLTNGFFQQSLDSWRAFVIFVQFILKTVAPHEACLRFFTTNFKSEVMDQRRLIVRK